MIRQAILGTIYECMKEDPTICIIGEGARVKALLDYPALLSDFPDRILSAPISEGGMVNMALGASVCGLRPIVDVTFNDLLLRAMEEILNEVVKIHEMSGNKLFARVIIKAEFTKRENAQSGNRYDYLFKDVAGLNVVIPQNEVESSRAMFEALHANGPTLFFEDRLIDGA